jgi:hypothetical protein
MIERIVACLLVSGCIWLGLKGEILFPCERVDAVILAPDTLEIAGTYWFVNRGKVLAPVTIFYPYPIDSDLTYPSFSSVTRLRDMHTVKFDVMPTGIRWTMTLASMARDSFQVVYRQHVENGHGRYIVTSGMLWRRPLECADFSVKVPPQLTLAFWNFKCDTVEVRKDTLIYRCRYTPFVPNTDMQLKWVRK